MTHAGRIIRGGRGAILLDELERIATDPQEDELARRDARNAIRDAAGQGLFARPHGYIGESKDDLPSLNAEARRRLDLR
jgi:hypothetical protein